MRAEIKSLFSSTLAAQGQSLETWTPDDPQSFAFYLQAFIGPVGQDNADSFQPNVCTPR